MREGTLTRITIEGDATVVEGFYETPPKIGDRFVFYHADNGLSVSLIKTSRVFASGCSEIDTHVSYHFTTESGSDYLLDVEVQ